MKMIVSAFKRVNEPNNPYHRSVLKCLDRIKRGASKDIILNYRKTGDDKYKLQLPGYCFAGTFSKRSIDGLKSPSGLAILDFDEFKSSSEAVDFKDSVCDLEYVFSAFISPSGKGVKVLVKIPKCNDEEYRLYFESLKEYFNTPYWDDSGKDISRFCFESYDPDIYINQDSKVWTKKEEPEAEDIGVGHDKVIVPLRSENQIINRLQSWFSRKYSMDEGQRNDNVYKFAIALSDFGIPQYTAESHLLQYAQKGFSDEEIKKTIASAYRKGQTNFGSKFFEDEVVKNEIVKEVRAGKTNASIKKRLERKNIEVDDINQIVEDIKDNLEVNEFWYYDDKNKIRLSPHKYKFYLEQNNFIKYFPADSNTFTFIKKDQNLIEETNEQRIKDYVLEDLLNRKGIGYGPYDFMAGNPGYFNINYLSMLKSAEIKIKEDTKTECFLYFKNCAVRVTKDNIEEIDYLDLDGYVWKNQIIDRDFVRSDHHPSEYRSFIWLISGKDVEKYNSFKSVIGYLLHSYKTSSRNRAVILNDETISDNPNGGSGKGLFWNALAKMKKISMIDGKTFDFTKSFPYQTVSTDCQILVFDDVKKNFSFESLFSVITEGITLEYKGQDAIKIPVEKSPKILITTNYTIGGVGGSHERRKFEMEMSTYFNNNNTPEDEFGHMLFDDWKEDEWSRFDNYMINCLQGYLSTLLITHEFNNLETRKIIKNTNMEFYEWSKDSDFAKPNIRIYKGEAYRDFIDDYPDYAQGRFRLSQKSFRNYLNELADFKGYEFVEHRDHVGRYFEYLTTKDSASSSKDNNGFDDIPF